jgi:predicted unusual protein kinase regulating ubiquinone biosynthesis (AarF/ABC1/UbiB family)
MQPQRADEIERAVEIGLQHSDLSSADSGRPPSSEIQRHVLRALPRRQLVHKIEAASVSLPMARRAVFRPGVFLPCVRLAVWLAVALTFFCGNALDSLLGRASVQRRAARFRRCLERAGASMIKVGQQLSVRADLLPYAYCIELGKLLDNVPPIPTQKAISIIERNLGRPIEEIFDTFDPTPIGSASLACVYQAVLKTGERVAVKVQRPGIGRLISADLRALDWLMIAAEALTLIRPGTTTQFRRELRRTLMGELNFRTEARYNEMFRLRVEQDDEGITAPRVFFQYCTEEVLVNELVSGTWMWELMVAVDRNDQEFLGNLRKMGIEPGIVARRLLRVLHRELLEHLFFHGDPHPANLVVLPNSRVCFIDFGAVGRFSTETRNGWRELLFHMQNRDVERMVRSAITLAGRLPAINVDDVLEAMEEIYADWVYAISSTDAEWWERCSAQTWLRHIKVAREFGMPVTLEMIQFFRATFLFDTMIVRLDKHIDPIEEWKSYARVAGKDARKRVRKAVKKRLNGPTGIDYLRIEALADTINQFFFRVQKNVDDPVFHFRQTVGKVAYGISTVLRLVYSAGILAGFAVIAEFVAREFFGVHRLWSTATLATIASFAWLKLIAVVLLLVVVRQVMIRMSEPDSRPERR